MNKYELAAETEDAIAWASQLQDKCLDHYSTHTKDMTNLLKKLERAKDELRVVLDKTMELEY